jgi:hypothetical protein
VFEEYFRQTHPPHNICWTAHCQLCLKNIAYRTIHSRIYVEPLIVNCVSRKYFSNTIDNQRFNIYSGMDCSVGNILQTQLTMSDSTYILGWKALYEIYFKYNWQWAVQHILWGGWVCRKYSSNTIDNHPFQNICWTINCQLCLKNIS